MVSFRQNGLAEAFIDAAGDAGSAPHAADALIVAAYCRAAETLLETMSTALAGPGPWLDRWERAVRAVVAAVRTRPGLARLALTEPESAAIRERRMRYRHAYIDVFAAEYARGRDPEELPGLHVELVAGAAYRAYVAETRAGRLTDPQADVVPRLVSVMAILEPAQT